MGDRPDRGVVAQPIADRDRLRIARQRDHVIFAEDPPLVQDRTADFAQYNAVLLWYEALVAPGIRHRLEIDPAHAAPLRRMVQDVANLAVVDPFAHSLNKGGRQANLFEI